MKERTRLEGAIAHHQAPARRRRRQCRPDRTGRGRGRRGHDRRRRACAGRGAPRGRQGAARDAAVGRGRRQQRLCRDQRRRRRHRSPGLGRDAGAHVHALGRAPRLQGELAGGERGRGGRHQVVRLQGRGPQRLWLAEDRNAACTGWCASRRSTATRGATPLRLGLGLSGGRRQHRDRDPGQGPARRHLPRLGRGRPARQQDRLCGAHHPLPDRHRRRRASRSAASTRTAPRRCRC